MNRIRLGPGRKTALSIEGAFPGDSSAAATGPAEPEPDVALVADWRSVIKAAGLTTLETRVFLKHWKDNVPLYQLPAILKCRPTEARAAYRAVIRKLGLSRQRIGESLRFEPIKNSLRLAYRQWLPSGRGPWCLTELDDEFARIMADEKKYIYLSSQQDPSKSRKTLEVCPLEARETFMVKDIELDGKLAEARSRLAALNGTSTQTADQVHQLTALLAKAESSATDEAEVALIESRRPDQKLRAVCDELRQKLAAAKEMLGVSQGAVARQRLAVEALEGEIRDGARQRVLAFAWARVRKIEELQDGANDLYAAIAAEAAREGVSLMASELFRHEESGSIITARFDQLQIGLNLRRTLCSFGRADAA